MKPRTNGRRAWLAMVLAGVSALAAPASAAVVTFTYKGIISEGYYLDPRLNSGLPIPIPAALPFTAVFVRDDAVAPTREFRDGLESGFIGHDDANPMRGFLTLGGGVTLEFGQTQSRQTQADDPRGCGPKCDLETFEHTAETRLALLDRHRRHTHNASLRVGGGATGLNLFPSFDYHTLPSIPFDGPRNYFLGEFSYIDEEYYDGDLVRYLRTEGVLQPHSLVVTVETPAPTPVPEPRTWALLITGFGAAGAMARRRRYRLGRNATSTFPAACPNEP